MKLHYNISSRAAQSNAVYVSVLKIPIVHGDSVRVSGHLEMQCRPDSILRLWLPDRNLAIACLYLRLFASSKVSKIEYRSTTFC